MATEVGSAPINGYGHQYGSAEGYGHQANTSTSTTGYGSAPVSGTSQQQGEISKEEVAWYFVESYYTTMSRSPEKLHLFFNKRSQFVSGVEEEKSSVAVGQKNIKDRLADLDYEDCKVRVTNVDSQASEQSIVIQVIGEMSNKSQPHRKFVQTFVLAGQTNGYFVLNDIFRYIKEDEDEPEVEADDAAVATGGAVEPAPTATEATEPETKETVVTEEDATEVDKKLDEVAAHEEPPVATINGTPAPEEAEVAQEEKSPAAAVSMPETKSPEPEPEAEKADVQPEEPKDPVPSPVRQSSQTSAPPAAPPKPAVPRTWAQLASANRAAQPAAPATSAPAPQQAKSSASKEAASAAPPTPIEPSATSAPARQDTPDSNKEGSAGGWQAVGGSHDRKQSRAQNAPAPTQDGRVRAFVKGVGDDVTADALKSQLSKYGEVVYFDLARQKSAAFVEFKTQKAFNDAVAANPHRIGSSEISVEERRLPGGGFASRGGRGGGRGGFEGRGGQGPRGGFRGGRGSGNTTPRGGRGGPQAA